MRGRHNLLNIVWFTRFWRASAVAVVAAFFMYGVGFAQAPVHWSYDGATGPSHWGELETDFTACATGHEQSPINIPASAAVSPAAMVSYTSSPLTMFNNGHTEQVNYDPGSSLMLDGVKYDLVQFHFHAASEHMVDGKNAPMEIHFVHKNAAGELTVIGVLLHEGAENAAYAPVFTHFAAHEGQPAPVAGTMVDADAMLPAQRTYWRYNGSLTTPPCTEQVNWLVMNTPVEISAAQIAAFTTIIKHNERPVQQLYDRQLLRGPGLPMTGRADIAQVSMLTAAALVTLLSGLVLLWWSRRTL